MSAAENRAVVGEPLPTGAGRSLQVTAWVPGPVCMPDGFIALDALLAWAVCEIEGVPHPAMSGEVVDVEIPVEREPDGRFHLCSHSVAAIERRERQWQNRRFPIEQAQALGGPSVRRVNTSAGRSKSLRRPREVVYLADGRMDWYCVGDAERIEALLDLVTHVGKHTGVGNGRVERWTVREVAGWRGFPVLLEGLPLRPLPVDWPGLADGARLERRTLTYPYWHDAACRAVPCACPEPPL